MMKKIEVEVEIYQIADQWENEEVFVIQDPYNTVQVSLLLTENREHASFEAEAYHLKAWAKQHGFRYKHSKKIIEIDSINC